MAINNPVRGKHYSEDAKHTRGEKIAGGCPLSSHLSVQEHLVVRHGLLLEHSQDQSEEPGLFRLEHVHDVAVRSPVEGEVLDQTVLRRFHLRYVTDVTTPKSGTYTESCELSFTKSWTIIHLGLEMVSS